MTQLATAMDNTIYYTLSTIAQTLAGALAILVAVVLFRLSALVRVIDEGRVEMRARNIDPVKAWPALRAGGFEGLAKYLEAELRLPGYRQPGPLRTASEKAYTAYEDWGRINRRLYLTLGATVTDIGLCFAVLPFTPSIAGSPRATIAVLSVAVALGIICLGLYVWLIAAMVRRPEE